MSRDTIVVVQSYITKSKKVEQIQTGEYIRGKYAISIFIWSNQTEKEKGTNVKNQAREIIHTVSCSSLPDNTWDYFCYFVYNLTELCFLLMLML